MAEVNVNPTRPQGAPAVSGDGAVPVLAKSTVDGTFQHITINGSGQLVVSGGGGGTEYVEDTASTGGEQGPLVMAIRVDTPGSLVNATGDYTALQVDASGALRVTGGGGGVQYVEDTAHASGDTGTMALAVRNDAGGSLVNATGDYTPLQTDSTGALRVTGGGVEYTEGDTDATITGTAILWEDAADTLRAVSAAKPLPVAQQGSVTVADGGGSLTVDGTVTANAGSGPWPVTDNAGSLTVDAPVATPVFVRLSDGAAPITALPVTDNAGSLTVDGTVAATQSGAWSVSAASALPVTDNAGSLTVDSTQLPAALVSGRLDVNVGNTPAVTVSSGSITADTELPNAAALADAASNPTTPTVGSATLVYNGTTWDRARGDTTNGIDVDVTRVSGTVTVDTEMPAAAALADAVANPTVPTIGVANLGYNGTTWDRLRSSTANGLAVDVTRVQGTVTVGTHAVTQSGTWNTVDAGDVAHDGADSGNPVKVGGQARTSEITSVASGDRANIVTDVQGRQIVAPYSMPDLLVQGVTAAITGTTDTAVIAAAGAGVRNYVTSLTVVNSHATVGTVVELKDGTTVIHRGYAAPAGGGYTVTFPTPLRGTANTAINAANVTTGSNTYVSASGYKSAA